MGRATRTAPSLLLGLFLAAAALPIRAGQPGEVVDRAGAVVRGHDESGRSIDSQLPPAPAESPAAPEQVTSPSADGGGTVQSDGSVEPTATAQPQSAALAAATPAAATVPLTIDYMTLRDAYSETYRPAGTIYLLGSAGTYTLSDGSTWSSGAGSYYNYAAYLDHVEVSGDTIRYFLDQRDGLLYQQTDYDSGDHSSQGTLGVSGALVLEATRGSTTAVLRGGAEIVSNTEPNASEVHQRHPVLVSGSR